MAVELVAGMDLRWEREGDLFYMDLTGADGTRRAFGIPGSTFGAYGRKIERGMAERGLAHCGSEPVQIGKGKRGKH